MVPLLGASKSMVVVLFFLVIILVPEKLVFVLIIVRVMRVLVLFMRGTLLRL